MKTRKISDIQTTDFGMTTLSNTSVSTHNDKITTINNHGSGFHKQERSDPDPNPLDDHQHFLQTCKSSRTEYFDQPNKSMPMRSDPLLSLSASDANNMLSFSTSSPFNNITKDGHQTSLFSFYQSPPAYIRNTGFASRYKGPFTPSQWMELEHQALIYKHFVVNVPVPSQLLSPLSKSFNSFVFPSSSASYAPNSYGWGTFHLGFSGNTDPEPGRCRRTDGKKWRCSRDAVPDQKYCERHINRGRHRSRKPVEGQNGRTVTCPTSSKVGPIVSSLSVPVSTARATTAALGAATLQRHNPAIAASRQTPITRTQESSDSLMHPTNYASFLDHGGTNPNPLPRFVDPWSKDEPLKPDWTQLSMSIPMASSDFSSTSNSPAQEKLVLQPLGLTPELHLDPTHKRASNWIPISWGDSMGGPLGEVLNRTSSSSGVKIKNLSSGSEMNQMTDMWDAVNCHMGSSPTGVLQKTTFVSLSNSSSGSSPKGNKKDEHGGSICDELQVL